MSNTSTNVTGRGGGGGERRRVPPQEHGCGPKQKMSFVNFCKPFVLRVGWKTLMDASLPNGAKLVNSLVRCTSRC